MFQASTKNPTSHEHDGERPRSLPAEPLAYRGGRRARGALVKVTLADFEIVEMAYAARVLISPAARRRISDLIAGRA